MKAAVAHRDRGDTAFLATRGFLGLLVAYVVTHVLVRLVVSPTLTIDDSREALFGQTLEWGYLPRQPPLYNWLVWAAFQLLGVGVLSLTVLKYALLFLTYLFVYLSGRLMLPDPRLAGLATFSLLLMIPVTWVVHEALTHTIAALAASAATFYVLLRLEASGGRWCYLAFGFTLGVGILSKFSYTFFAAALLIASLAVDRFRRRILNPRMLIALGVTVALVLPYMLWFHAHDFSMARLYSEELQPGIQDTYFQAVSAGLYYVVRMVIYYLTPLGIVVVMLFPKAWVSTPPTSEASAPGRSLLERFLVVELTLLVVGALLGALTYLKFRWVMPVFFLVPLYVFSRIDSRGLDAGRVGRFATILLVAEIIVVLAIFANIYRGDRFGRPSRLNVPYDAIATQIAAAGFAKGTIAAGEGPLAGNLRLRFPGSRIVRLTNPDYVPPGAGGGQCLIVWEKAPRDAVPKDLAEWTARVLGVTLTGRDPIRVAEARYRFSTEQTLRVHYLLLPEGAGRCQ